VGWSNCPAEAWRRARQFNFLVESASDDVSLNHKEHADYQWLDISRVPFEKMNMSKATRKSITAALKLRETTAAPGCTPVWRDSSVAGRF